MKALFLLLFTPCFLWAGVADWILINGKIVTVNEHFSIHEAVAIEEERISFIGKSETALRLKGANTKVVDLKGKMVLPGLIDSHTHSVGASVTEFDHPIPAMESVADVLGYIRKRSEILKEGEWIVVSQVFITRLNEQRYPTRAELDSVAPKHPVAFRTGPDAMLNTKALEVSGIDENFAPREGGGFAEKDPKTGKLTGLLRNSGSAIKIKSSNRTASLEDKVKRLAELFEKYNSVGITSVCDRNAGQDEISVYRELQNRGNKKVRVNISRSISAVGPLDGILTSIRETSKHELFTKGDDWVRIIGIKTFLDGGMLTGSAYMREPWGVSKIYGITDPNYRGVRFIPQERLEAMMKTAAENGLQFTAHAVGDGAVHAMLDAYEKVGEGIALHRTRPCISHCNFMSQESVKKAAKLGVCMDIQPAWLNLDAHTLARQFGYERLRYFQPLRSLFAEGVIAGGGSDHMQKIEPGKAINPYNPFLGMATAVTRKSKKYQSSLHPEEALSRKQAIQFYTINNARVLRCDDKVGSIEVGKLADMIVVDRDLLTCPDARIADTKVLRTFVGGQEVYSGSE